MTPPDPAKWEAATKDSCAAVAELRRLLAAEFPAEVTAALALPATDGQLVRRFPLQWLDLSGRFDAMRGRVALVGDAAHAMTPDLGEGANCALESAVALDEALGAELGDGAALTEETLTAAIVRYGASRPAAARGVMLRSVGAARSKTQEALDAEV